MPAVTNNGGTVDKYLGDGFLALFETRNAESSARAALTAVQEIGQALEDYNARMQAEGAQPIAIGLGLHLGDVVIGEIGATGNAPRTLIGDTVNTASRLESKTKELGVQLLISDSVLQAAGYDTAEASLQALELRGLDAPLSALALHRRTWTRRLRPCPGARAQPQLNKSAKNIALRINHRGRFPLGEQNFSFLQLQNVKCVQR